MKIAAPLLLSLIALSALALAEDLRVIDLTVRGDCAGKPIVVVTKDFSTGEPVRAQVKFMVNAGGMWEERHFGWTDASNGTLVWYPEAADNYTIRVERAGYVTYDGTIAIDYCPECRSDYNCSATQYCLNNSCVNVTGTCGYAHNHRWVPFECCSNDACAEDASCVGHMCVRLVGACGRAINHTWYSYDCCTDSACGSGKQCVDHACVVLHQCEIDADCALEQACVSNRCIALTGNCGYASNHRWVNYECCMDATCPSGYCLDDHTCSPRARATATPGNGGVVPVGGYACDGTTGMILLAGIAAVLLVFIGGLAFLVGRMSHRKPKGEESG